MKQRNGQLVVPASRLPAVIYGLMLILGGVGLADAIARRSVPMILLLVGAVVTMGMLAFRGAGAGVFIDGGHIVGRREYVTRRVKVADVEHFEYRGWKGLGVVGHEGTWTPLVHLPSTQADEALRELERELKRLRRSR